MLSEEEIHKNFDELLKVQNQICLEKNLEYKDKIEEILVDGVSNTSDDILCGRTNGGKLVSFKGDKNLTGKYIKVKITNPKQFSLEGEIVSE